MALLSPAGAVMVMACAGDKLKAPAMIMVAAAAHVTKSLRMTLSLL
jgi:hypothetical protein